MAETVINIPEWSGIESQYCSVGSNHWSVARLLKLAEELEIMEVPLVHLNIYHQYSKLSLRDMVMHMRAVEAADLDCPILLDEDGELMDGRHRLMKAMLENRRTIKAVRFSVNPEPCSTDSD